MKHFTKLLIVIIVIATLFSASSITYNFGVKDGYTDGRKIGLSEGEKTGYDKGYPKGFDSGKISGYSQGYSDGYGNGTMEGAGTGYNIRDPTYSEMMQFIETDRTNQRTWTETYTCFNFANDVLVNAFNSGYKAGMVYMEFADGAHAIVCFKTTDRGMIFVEPQSDEITTIQIGKAYDFVAEPNIVLSYTIIW